MAARLSPSDALFTRTQQRLLTLLFGSGGEYSLNALIRRSGGGSGAIRREVERLLAAGIARERRAGNQRLIAAEPASPCYAPLKTLAGGPAAASDLARRRLRPSTALLARRAMICKILAARGLSNPRVFGSVVHGRDSEASDLDLLVDARRDTSLLDLATAQRALEEALGVRVDLVTLDDLPKKFRNVVLAEAVPL